MSLLTQAQIDQLIYNGSADQKGKDHVPVVKLYTKGGPKWLLTELHPYVQCFAYGLCQVGRKAVVMGKIDLYELSRISRENSIPVYNDPDFKAIYPISVYAEAASVDQEIREDEASLQAAAARITPQATPPKLKMG